MEERELRGLIDRVGTRRLSRRRFIRRMMAVGLSAPMANQLLAATGVAMAQTRSNYTPTRRGGGGTLKVLWWQAPTLLNPHFATGTKDRTARASSPATRQLGPQRQSCRGAGGRAAEFG